MITSNQNNRQDSHPAVLASASWPSGQFPEQVFISSFCIGRDPQCDIHINDPVVSRHHAEVILLADTWWIRDCNSANGIFVDGQKVDRIPISKQLKVGLGKGGPLLVLSIEQPYPSSFVKKEDPLSMTHYRDHYFSDQGDEEVGEHTMMVRRAFAQVQKKQKRKYGAVICLITCLFFIAGSVAVYKHLQVTRQKELAGEIFYAMKTLEIEFADLLRMARESEDPEAIAKIEQYKKQARELENNYSEFVDILGIYGKKISPQERIILKMARTFGECEIIMPDDFTSEVMRYIDKWKSSKRFSRAIARAKNKGYPSKIIKTMRLYNLPPQFFYLALQESDFNINACGPKTRWGIAKGMWQFIPGTGSEFGLKIGPLSKVKKPDPKDDRHNFAKSTEAAARYLRKIYDTDAQASGLLVMASYNWGHNRVNRLIKAMPQNPKERNFWEFLKLYRDKIPKETYDYVFKIFSAAVIGENPRLFGFDFDNPLAMTKRESTTQIQFSTLKLLAKNNVIATNPQLKKVCLVELEQY